MKSTRWWIIGLAFVGLIVTYFDRMALSFAVTPLQQTFHLNNADFGSIAAAFGLGSISMTVIGGVLIDRYGARSVWSIAALCWAATCFLLSIATGFVGLFIFRALLGMAEGPCFPALSRVTADWLNPQEQAKAFAIALAAVPLSSVIGAPLLSFVVAHYQWRCMFVSIGILSGLWAIAWYLLFRNKPPVDGSVATTQIAPTPRVPTTWRFMILNPALLSNNVAFFALGYLVYFSLIWLPAYFEQVFHSPLTAIGWFLTIPWLVATAMLLLGGFLSDFLWRKYQNFRIARSHIIWPCQLLSALCLLGVVHAKTPTQAIMVITLSLGFGMMPNAIYFAINTDLAKDRAATSLGFMSAAFGVAGILAPYLTGKLSTLTGNFDSAIYLLIAITLTSALGILLFQHPSKKV